MAGPVRSLADDLRGRGDEALAALLAARPDLIHPMPADLAALAHRAGSPGSVAAALRRHDQLTLQVVLLAALAPDPTTAAALVSEMSDRLAPHVGAATARERVRACVARLREEALLWGTDRSLHLVGAARDLVVPADRGPAMGSLDPVIAGLATDPDTLRARIEAAPQGARAALDRLLAGALVGSVADARRTPDPARSAVDWLLAEHLVVPFGTDRVVVPAEVAAALRGSPAPPPALPLEPPRPRTAAPDPQRVEAGAVGATLDVLHAVAELGVVWTQAPPARLRTGGIGQRDLARTARAVGVDEPTAALLIEVAAAAGLLAPDSHEVLTVLPTTSFDRWVADPPAQRMAELLLAWRDMPRAVGPDLRPLAPEGAAPAAPDLRGEVLAVLASAPGAWTTEEALQALRWWAPRRDDPARSEQARRVLDQLRSLGLLVSGTPTATARALHAGDRDALVAALAAHLPAQVDTLVMQADLTAIVPGLPTPELAALMRQVAAPESVGAASVYRFSAGSVRAALDAGRTAADLLAELGRRGTVPQPLAYLVEDVARRHAALRIGAAATYLRCDDPVELASILADPRAAALGLRAVSDTVLVSALPPELVHERLRELGRSPRAEVDGALAAPPARRARSRRTPAEEGPAVGGGPGQGRAPSVSPALAGAAVRALRASDRGDRGAGSARPGERGGEGTAGPGGADDQGVPAVARGSARGAEHPVRLAAPADVVAALRGAIAAESEVWIGYADPSGVASDRRIQPLRLTGGYLTALDLRTESIASYALARITGVESA